MVITPMFLRDSRADRIVRWATPFVVLLVLATLMLLPGVISEI